MLSNQASRPVRKSFRKNQLWSRGNSKDEAEVITDGKSQLVAQYLDLEDLSGPFFFISVNNVFMGSSKICMLNQNHDIDICFHTGY